MSGRWESIAGFFVLGSRHLFNSLGVFSLKRQMKRIDRNKRVSLVNLGRKARDLKLVDAGVFPAVGKLQQYELALEEQQAELANLKNQINELSQQRRQYEAHYDNKLKQQFQLKRPVDDELTSLLGEIKRMRRELQSAQSESKTLTKKISLLQKRIEELGKSNQGSNQYIQTEIVSEIELNERSRELKIEKSELLRTHIEDCLKREENIRKVLQDYNAQISRIRVDQKDMIEKLKSKQRQLDDKRNKVDARIQLTHSEMTPTFEELGSEVAIRRVESEALLDIYSKLEALEREANKFNLTLSASPTESLAFIGGAISTCASGVRGFGHGSIRNYVEEIDVVLPSGLRLTIPRGKITADKRRFDFEYADKHFVFNAPSYSLPEVKSQAGYFSRDNVDLIDLFIGSEGTLGVITSCVLSLQALASDIFDILAFFPKERDALLFVEAIKKLKRQNKLNPASIEFFDVNALNFLKPEYNFIPKVEAAVYIEQEVRPRDDCDKLIEQWQNLLNEHEALLDKSIFADTRPLRTKVFEFRHKLPQLINEFLRQKSQVKAATDIAVPDHQFSRMYETYCSLGREAGIDFVNFGHIGESHLHFNFLPKNDNQAQTAKKYIELLCKSAVSLGGTVSAEHGIGKLKKPYLKIMYTPEQIKEMAALKKYFDPDCLLNLDNIFEKELLYEL